MPAMQSMHCRPEGGDGDGGGTGPGPMHAVALGQYGIAIPSMQFMHGGVVMLLEHQAGSGQLARDRPGTQP